MTRRSSTAPSGAVAPITRSVGRRGRHQLQRRVPWVETVRHEAVGIAAALSRADFLHGTDSAIYPGQAAARAGHVTRSRAARSDTAARRPGTPLLLRTRHPTRPPSSWVSMYGSGSAYFAACCFCLNAAATQQMIGAPLLAAAVAASGAAQVPDPRHILQGTVIADMLPYYDQPQIVQQPLCCNTPLATGSAC